MIDTRLITLLTLMETKNYTKTAEVLYITQPAVTHHIKSLEKENNISLFTNSKLFKLSSSGLIIYEYAKKAVEQYQQLKIALLSNVSNQNKLNFSVTNQISFSFMNQILRKWLIVHPKDQINMHIDTMDIIIKKISEGSIDFAIVDNSFDKMKYDFVQLYKSSVVLVVGINHPLAHKQKIKVEQLKDECVILDNIGSGLRTLIEAELHKRNIYLSSFSNIIEIDDPFVIKNLVINNSGLGFFYLSSIQKELNSNIVKIIELVDIELKQEFNLVYSLDNFVRGKYTKIADEMIRFSREELYK